MRSPEGGYAERHLPIARRPGLHADRPRPRRGLRARRRRPTPTASPAAGHRASRSCGPGCRTLLVRATTSRSRPARSSRRRTTTPSTSTSSRPRSRATPADGHQFDGHHAVDDEAAPLALSRAPTRPARSSADRSPIIGRAVGRCADPSLVHAVRRRPVACSRRTTPTRRWFTTVRPAPGALPAPPSAATARDALVQTPLHVRGAGRRG